MQFVRQCSLIRPSFRLLSLAITNVAPSTTQKELAEINKLMKTYNNTHMPIRTLALFEWMLNITQLKPDFNCYLHIIRACGEVKHSNFCQKIEQFIANDRTLRDQEYGQLQSKLIYMYARMQQIDVAEQIFQRAKGGSNRPQNLSLFGTMFKAYNMNGQAEKTIELYEREMINQKTMELDAVTATCVLNACSDCRRLDLGKHVHGEVIRLKLHEPPNIRLATALMDMYCNCGLVDRAREIFDLSLSLVDHIAYSTLMKAYLAINHPAQVLALFRQLQSSSLSPDSLLYLNVIHACRQLGLAHQAEDIHRLIPSYMIEKNPVLQTALIDMHAYCSHLPEADRLFRLLERKEGHSLTSLLHALAINGLGQQALNLFEEVQSQVKLNEQVYKMLLYACAFTDGLVDQARRIYQTISEKYKTLDMAATMVKILARASLFDEVHSFIRHHESRSRNISPLWSAFFMVCYHSGNLHYAKLIHKHIAEDRYLSLLFSDMTHSIPPDDVIAYFRQQSAGKCWTETKSADKTGYTVHEFNDYDRSKFDVLDSELDVLIDELKSAGVNWEPIPNDPQGLFCGHTAARLALACNFVSSSSATAVHLTKSKPLCHTCHQGMKQLTVIRQCDIVVRDPVRVHHFHDGHCSCHDRF